MRGKRGFRNRDSAADLSIISIGLFVIPVVYRRISPLALIYRLVPFDYRPLATEIWFLAMAIVQVVMLWSPGVPTVVAVGFAFYALIEVVTFQLVFVFIHLRTDEVMRHRTPTELLMLTLFNGLQLVLAFALLYQRIGTIDGRDWNAQPVQSIYFSVVTMSTVGFGDYTAGNDLTRWLVIGQLATFVLLVGLAVPVIVSLTGQDIGRTLAGSSSSRDDSPAHDDSTTAPTTPDR